MKSQKQLQTGPVVHATQPVTASQPIAVEYLPVSDLVPDARNPRVHSKQQVRAIARSIKTFGFNVPVLIDPKNQVVAGHGRFLAVLELGLRSIPTIRLEHLSDEQLRAFMLADNRLTEISTWNDALLAEQLKELSLADLDFDLEAIGFEMGEIDFRIQGEIESSAGPDPADDQPADSGPPVVKQGELWECGKHRIYCGNALDKESYVQVLGGKLATTVFADFPYNLKIAGNVSGRGKVKHPEFQMASGEMSEEEFVDFLTKAFRQMAAHSTDGSTHFACLDWRHLSEYLQAGKAVYGAPRNLCVWTKDNAGLGSMYRSQHELVFVFKSGSASARNNIQLGRFGRHRSNVWPYPGANSFARRGEEGNLLALHPTVKPVSMVADAILDCSARGDVVLDPFLGSGTTVIAAERTGRVAAGIELEPRYVDAAIRRWQRHTGDEAREARTGRTFARIERDAKKGEVRHA